MMGNKISTEFLKRKLAELEHKPESTTFDGGGGGGYHGDMEKRLTTLETKLEITLPTLATKGDIESVKVEIHKSSSDTQKWMIATVVGLFVGFGGLFLAMSNALKPTPAAQQSPVVIYSQPSPITTKPLK